MTNFFKKIIFNSVLKNTLNNLEVSNIKHSFLLKYQNNVIGLLVFDGVNWNFNYSDWFKKQHDFRPLIEFPNKDKQYQSNELWTFFASRIPSLKQPKVQEFISENNNKVDFIELLKKFGKTSVNNPYHLDIL